MTEPEASPAPRWPWLDRWFEPPWRALLTWVGCATLTGWAMDQDADQGIANIVYPLFDQLDRVLPMPLPRELRLIAVYSNICLLYAWIEPLALRLNLMRSLAWLGIRIIPTAAVDAFVRSRRDLIAPLSTVGVSMLGWLVLSGWRSRPWMVVIGGLLVVGASDILDWFEFDPGRTWLWALAAALPCAAVLLYGTRRLPR